MNNLICETISSTHNKDKINIHGYLMLKDRNRKNLYYWRCEKYKSLSCYGRATTLLVEGQHYLKKASDHNHAAEASRVGVLKTINILKERAQQTADQRRVARRALNLWEPHDPERGEASDRGDEPERRYDSRRADLAHRLQGPVDVRPVRGRGRCSRGGDLGCGRHRERAVGRGR